MSQQRGHTETGPLLNVLSHRPEKRGGGVDLVIPGLVVKCDIHYTIAATNFKNNGVCVLLSFIVIQTHSIRVDIEQTVDHLSIGT